MPLGALEAAKKACERTGWRLSNLQLQKILYLAELRFKRAFPGTQLINSEFEAWDYGPVIPDVYHKVKVFGSGTIGNVFHSVNAPLRNEDSHFLASVDILSAKRPATLVEITHRGGGAWATYYRPGVMGLPIPRQAIQKEANIFPTP